VEHLTFASRYCFTCAAINGAVLSGQLVCASKKPTHCTFPALAVANKDKDR